jgi:hypothetical protein
LTAKQLQLFPRHAVIEYPPSNRSADCLGMVDADDGGRYYIKTDVHGRPVRASEWLGTHLAEVVGIQAPMPAVIKRSDGTLVFGSRRIAGVADDVVTRVYLTTPSASNSALPIVGLTSLLSKIYALDMFLFNEDRHLGNYISVDDNGVRRLYAFDFSRALFWRWPWPGYPAGDNTRTCGTMLRQLHGFDDVAAGSVLDNLCNLAPQTVEGFINQMPLDWSTPDLRSQFVDVWATGHCSARADVLRKGFKDGTLL